MTKRRFCFMFFMLICFSLPLTATAQTVNIPDPNLRAIIADALGKTSGEAITRAEMTNLTILDAPNANITDLTGLEYATDLTELDLGGEYMEGYLGPVNSNSVWDLSPLSGLTNLTRLVIEANSVSDISALAGLTNLEYLNLADNLISDISALVGLTNLEYLELGGDRISDISALANLTNLTELSLWGESISDISALANLTNLTELWLSGTSVSDISALAGLTKLIDLNLSYNPISDISPLVANRGLGRGDTVYLYGNPPLNDAAFSTHIPALLSRGVRVQFPVDIPDPNLQAAIETALGKASGATINVSDMAGLTQLEARNANISDLTGLEAATNLTSLVLWENSISDISALSGLTHLTWLNLGVNTISDISAVVGLMNLTELVLRDNSISDISALADLTNLRSLNLLHNPISDISALANLTNLTDLSLANNVLSDISTLAGLTNLTKLILWNLPISDISPVSGLTNLTSLEFDGNNITDISAIANLTNLNSLTVINNSISDISPASGLTNLANLQLGGNNISNISAVAGLTHLTFLSLWDNSISDISPLVANTGLGSGDEIRIQKNPLSYLSIHTHIPVLQSRGVTVEFDDQAHPALLKVSGDNQEGMPNETLAQLLVVEVQDTDSSPLVGVPVTFTIVAGGGTLSATHTTTDANGRAQSLLTLGPNQGPQSVSVSATGIVAPVTFHAISEIRIEYLLSIPTGISLIHVPLKVTEVNGVAQTIESIGDLYDALGGADTVNFLITYDSSTQAWRSFFVPADKGTPADRRLTDDMGIIAGMKALTSVQFRGDPLGTDGSSTITLNQGLNLVGLPLRDSRITRVSDLFDLDGIGGNVPVIILTDGEEFKVVGRAGDPGDIAITGGQAFIMTASRAATVDISGDAWANGSGTAAAPPVTLKGIEVGDTTPVLGLRGAIVDEGTGLNNAGFRVTVKNLSTGRAVAAVTTPDEAGYRSTVVDIETGRAATVGDILEISAQSPNPFIGVQPLQYTVTAEDVKQSLIQLPELVAYEIPAETELLRNYPNPFNPETWIPYRLAEDAFVTLTIYDQSGQVVRTLDVGHRIAAVYESRSKAIYWDGRNGLGEQVASGVYFYHLSAGDYSATRRLVILK